MPDMNERRLDDGARRPCSHDARLLESSCECAVLVEALRERIAEFGGGAFLISASAEGRVHVASIAPRVDGAVLVVVAGRTTLANVATNPSVTVLWPRSPDGAYSLIVDGLATAGSRIDGGLVVTPSRAVLHRLANVVGDEPRCVPVTRPQGGALNVSSSS